MDFALTPELEALKREIRAFLEAELPDEVPEPQIVPETGTDEEFAFQLAFSKKLAEHGWYTAQWPKEHGGRGFDAYQALVVGEELGSHGVSTVNSIGHLVASLLMQYGDEEQQQRFLPGIANCDVIWGEGYSEPDSGADLASLRTVARKDGDEYVVDGTKIWTGAGYRAHWMFVYSRTDTEAPKHRGISYVLVDMESPGVSVTPLPNLANVITFAQEFFEDVHVPAENIIGEPNTGWQQRAGVVRYHSDLGSDSHAKHRRHIDDLIEYLRDDSNGSRSRDSDVLVRQRVARMVTDVEISNVLAWRNASLQTKGEMTLTAAESTGVYNRELTKRVAQIAIECLGLYGPLMPNDPRAKLRGWYANAYQFSLAATIYGGTVDIHRNVLATRGLGMPRELSLPRS